MLIGVGQSTLPEPPPLTAEMLGPSIYPALIQQMPIATTPSTSASAQRGVMDWLRANQTVVLMVAGVLFALAVVQARR